MWLEFHIFIGPCNLKKKSCKYFQVNKQFGCKSVLILDVDLRNCKTYGHKLYEAMLKWNWSSKAERVSDVLPAAVQENTLLLPSVPMEHGGSQDGSKRVTFPRRRSPCKCIFPKSGSHVDWFQTKPETVSYQELIIQCRLIWEFVFKLHIWCITWWFNVSSLLERLKFNIWRDIVSLDFIRCLSIYSNRQETRNIPSPII